MTRRRFFIPPDQLDDPNPYIQGDEARHLLKVLRLKVGDEVVLFDNSGQECPSRICAVSKDKVCFEMGDRQMPLRESPLDLSLGVPLIRSQPFEWILQKGTEMGVSSFHPFFSAHSSRNFQKTEQENRSIRWQRIVQEAAKQCRRNVLPLLHPMVSFVDLIQQNSGGIKIIPYEEESGRTLVDLKQGHSFTDSIMALVGPEGGFTSEEVGLAEEKGFVSISLGPRTLRSETAALALIGLCQFLWGDMGAGRKGGEDALP
jgi:16S rRNA (uracil1498-N3)-methyltransferase